MFVLAYLWMDGWYFIIIIIISAQCKHDKARKRRKKKHERWDFSVICWVNELVRMNDSHEWIDVGYFTVYRWGIYYCLLRDSDFIPTKKKFIVETESPIQSHSFVN